MSDPLKSRILPVVDLQRSPASSSFSRGNFFSDSSCNWAGHVTLPGQWVVAGHESLLGQTN